MEQLGIVLITGINIFLWWLLVAVLWRDYQIDLFRQRVFEIRDRVFDVAAGGQISFNERAYTDFRVLANSLIRYAHRMRFSSVVIGLVLRPAGDEIDFMQSVAMLPNGPAKKRIVEAHGEVLSAIFYFLWCTSPVMALISVVGQVLKLFPAKQVRQKIVRHVETEAMFSESENPSNDGQPALVG